MERIAKPEPTPKSAMDVLVDSFMCLREEAKQRMSEKEFQEAEQKAHELADRIASGGSAG